MHNGIKYLFIFSIGAAVGTVVTWQYLKPKYERMIQEEVDEFKLDWSRREHEKVDDSEHTTKELESLTSENEDIIMREKYAKVLEKGGSNSMNDDDPYVISPLKFAEEDEDYEVVSLIYHADGILVDDMGELIEDVEGTVGLEFPEHFGEYTEDPDTVYVRNERLMIDYEIQRDLDTYPESKNNLNPTDDQ